jgi:hypothetical protein
MSSLEIFGQQQVHILYFLSLIIKNQLEKKRIRERSQPGLAHAAVRPSTPVIAHGPPAISFRSAFLGSRPPSPFGLIDYNMHAPV